MCDFSKQLTKGFAALSFAHTVDIIFDQGQMTGTLKALIILWCFGSQVGLAVGDIETVQKNAFLRYKGKVVDFVTGIERKFPKWITRRLYRPELTVTGRKVEKKITSQ